MEAVKSITCAKTVAVVVAMLGLIPSAANARSGPFAPMAGAWFRGGKVILSDGQMERIRCRATDDVGNGGNLMRQHLRCASPSYNFDVQNMVIARHSEITGSWDETTHDIGGQITGRASTDFVRARVEGGQFAADVTLVRTGNSLRVTLAPRGTDVREVEVILRRT